MSLFGMMVFLLGFILAMVFLRVMLFDAF